MDIVYIFVQKSSRPCGLLQHFFSTMTSFESLQTFKTEADEWFTPKSFKDCLYQLVSGAKESFQVSRLSLQKVLRPLWFAWLPDRDCF